MDRIAPDNPVLLQASYYEAYLNSRALQTLGIDEKTPANDSIARDGAGKPTGRIGEDGFRGLVARLPIPPPDEIEASSAAMIKDLNRSGLTAFGSAGCEQNVLPTYRKWQARVVNVRVFLHHRRRRRHHTGAVDRAFQIAQMKLLQGTRTSITSPSGKRVRATARPDVPAQVRSEARTARAMARIAN